MAVITAVLLISATHFPYDVDNPLSAEELERNRNYYADAYRKNAPLEEQSVSDYDTKYLQIASQASEHNRIEEQVADFISKYQLSKRALLDVGSGRGYLQDVVEDYTGLDISASVSRFYHKKFVLVSATEMPLSDNAFDGAWSIWVLEHVPNPEQALMEIRRVLKNGALLFLLPACFLKGKNSF